MSENNRKCLICGKGYHVCKSCANAKTFRSWRLYADCENCFNIYAAINAHSYGKITDEQAISELKSCDLSEIESFVPNVKKYIKNLLNKGSAGSNTADESTDETTDESANTAENTADESAENTESTESIVEKVLAQQSSESNEAETVKVKKSGRKASAE